MDVSGKLVELLAPTSLNFEEATYLADCLVNNGVTVQDWISVDVAPVVHGRWIDNGACGYKWAFSCSKCGYIDG